MLKPQMIMFKVRSDFLLSETCLYISLINAEDIFLEAELFRFMTVGTAKTV